MADATGILRGFNELLSGRTNFDTQWQEVAERVWPERSMFTTVERTQGDKRTEFLFDATAMLALPKFAAAIDSMITPRTRRWHKLTVPDESLAEDHSVKTWLDIANESLWRARYSPKANFAGQQSEVYMSIGAFGNGIMFVDDVLGVGIRYKSCHLGEVYFAENWYGKVDKVYRRFKMSARQMLQAFGKACGPKVTAAMERSPESEFAVIHCVMPNENKGGLSRSRMAFSSTYVCEDDKAILSEGGYRVMPYIVYRHITTPGEVYGRGPAMSVLPAIKTANEMSKTLIRAGHLMTRPPLLLTSDGALNAFSLRPDALNFGMLDPQGNEMVKPLNIQADVRFGDALLERERDVINDAFLINLFRILVDSPTMTATEAMIRAQEKGQLLTPTMGRHQSEGLGPMLEREIDILAHAGALPPMPEALIEAGGELVIEYTGELNRIQRAEDGVAILRTFEQLAPIAQIDPSVYDIFDAKAVVRELSSINGVPAKVLRSKEAMEEMEENKQQQQQAAQMLQAAPVVSSSIKDLMAAQQMAGQAGQSVIPA